jgi:hypothetical protein
MSTLKARLLTNWHFVRVFRLGIGIMMLVMGIQNKDWAIGLFSAFFLYQAITDTGCCGSQGCAPPKRKGSDLSTTRNHNEVIEFEEVK